MNENHHSTQLENEIENAYSLAVNGRLEEAEVAYIKLLEKFPDEPRILGTLGAIALHKGLLSQAEEFLRKCLQLAPEQAKPWFNLSVVLFRLGDYDGAMTAIDHAQTLGFAGAETFNNRGIILNAQNRPDDALAALNAALALNPTYVDAFYNKGTVLQRQGCTDEASECYERVLALSPNHSTALYNLAILQGNRQQHSLALGNLCKAIALRPDFVEALVNRGAILLDTGREEEALADTEKAIELAPDHAGALFQKGNILLQRNNAEEALTYFSRVRQINPQHTGNLTALGVAHFELKDFSRAVAAFDEAIALEPLLAQVYNNKGLALQESKLYEPAIENYRKAIELKPDFSDALYNYANALRETEALEEALALYARLLEVDPEYVVGWKNMGATLDKLKRWDEALKVYERVIYFSPASAEAYFNAGTVLIKLNKLEQALRYANKTHILDPNYADGLYLRALILMQLGLADLAKTDADKAVELKPRHALANDMLGAIYVEQKNPVDALTCYEIAIAETGDIDFLLGKIAHLKMQLSDWRQHEDILNRLLASIEQDKPTCEPFELHSLIDSPEYHKRSAEIFYQLTFKKTDGITVPQHESSRRIHLAYFSSDIGNHPVGNLMVGVLEAHDKKNYEISVFTLDNQSGSVRDRIFRASERFINAEFLNDDEIVALARSLKVDLAIDLNGFTGKNRTGIFQQRVAPIQINYIGYLGTMGSDCHDYIIADPVMAPIEHEAHFTEKIIQLPCYQANDDKLEVPPTDHSRAYYDLPADAFVFCSFNANYKITPPVFEAWMQILHQVPDSVLWLHSKTETAINNLRQAAESHGISGNRLIFARTAPYLEHLTRQRLADLFLDTHPYNAGATASNALYCGLPLVTLLGKAFCSRYGGSLLTALDLPELITHSIEAYVSLCVKIASDKTYHAQLKEKLARNLKTQPLFDTKTFTRNLETAIRTVYTHHRQGLAPKHIGLTDTPSN